MYEHDVYSRSYPARFLWTDFEDEVSKSFEQSKNELEDKKAKAAILKEQRLALCLQVYDKLTPEERSVVTFPSEFKKALEEKRRKAKHAHNMLMRDLHRP